MKVLRQRLRRYFLTGLAALLPTVLTVFVIYKLVGFVNDVLGKRVYGLIDFLAGRPVEVSPATANGIAVLLVIGIVLLLGCVVATLVGRRTFRFIEDSLVKLPFVKIIYSSFKQVTDFFLSETRLKYNKVVALEYPRRGMYSIGFVTGDGMRTINKGGGRSYINVFIPSSPTPMTGYVVFISPKEVIPLPITVDEAIRFTMSGGVIVPPAQLVSDHYEVLADEPKERGDTKEPRVDKPEERGDSERKRVDRPRGRADSRRPRADRPRERGDSRRQRTDRPKERGDTEGQRTEPQAMFPGLDASEGDQGPEKPDPQSAGERPRPPRRRRRRRRPPPSAPSGTGGEQTESPDRSPPPPRYGDTARGESNGEPPSGSRKPDEGKPPSGSREPDEDKPPEE